MPAPNVNKQTPPPPAEPAKEVESREPPSPLSLPAEIPSEPLHTAHGFELAQRIATAFARSTLVPKAYQGNIPNALIAVEIAARLRMSPLQVMQSLVIVNGQPGWYSQFIIASINTCGRFGPLGYVFTGEGMSRTCKAVAVEKSTGERIEGSEITMSMAKAEGWLDRPGSKWKTMPEHMLRFRAATFFGREYVPEKLLGMPAADELGDIIDVTPDKGTSGAPTGIAGAKEVLSGSSTS